MSTLPFRVTVVDDHALFAEALVIALRGQSVDARSVDAGGGARRRSRSSVAPSSTAARTWSCSTSTWAWSVTPCGC